MTKEKKYPGQKKINGVYHKIINNIPAHKFYYELFAGSAAIAKMLLPVSDAIFYLNDINVEQIIKLTSELAKHRVEFFSIDAIKTIGILSRTKQNTEDRFIFLDPPYLHSTRPNSTKLYEYEMSDAQHQEMLLAVLQLKCNCMIIHPKCELYDTILKDWCKVRINIRYHNKTSHEILYMNYPAPRTLQTDLFLGNDCWDRQRIQRKSKRWIDRLNKLPELERKLIITNLKKQF